MTTDRPSWVPRITRRRLIGALVAGLVVFLAPTAIKWALYERADAAPRLRSLIGTKVTLPQQTHRVLGRDVVSGPHTGTLTHVDYRVNDKWGWFDLEVRLEGGKSGVGTGLSPGEALRVEAADDPNQRLQFNRRRPRWRYILVGWQPLYAGRRQLSLFR